MLSQKEEELTDTLSAEVRNLSGLGDLFVAATWIILGIGPFRCDFLLMDLPHQQADMKPVPMTISGWDSGQIKFRFGYYYPNVDQSTALMLGLTYEINTKMKGEDFNPGNRFSLEYGISQYLSDRFEFRIMGGHNWQVSDDKGEDIFWDPSYHDRKSTLAFSPAYWAVNSAVCLGQIYVRFWCPSTVSN